MQDVRLDVPSDLRRGSDHKSRALTATPRQRDGWAAHVSYLGHLPATRRMDPVCN